MKLASMSLTILTLMSLTACGNSPLMNHVTANTTPVSVAAVSPAQGKNMPGCNLSFTKSGLCAITTWVVPPTSDEYGTMSIQFFNATTGEASDIDGTLFVKLWMPSMGHGSSPVETTQPSKGVYTVKNVYFTMPGEWEVRVQIKKDNQVIEQANLKVTI